MPPPRIVEVLVNRKQQKFRERLNQLLQFRIFTLFVLTTIFACVSAVVVVLGKDIQRCTDKKLQYLSQYFPIVEVLDFFRIASVPLVIVAGAFVFRFVFHRKTEKSFKRFCLVGLIGFAAFWMGVVLLAYGTSKPVGIGKMILAALGSPLMFAGWFLPVAAFFAWFFGEPRKSRH